jgi:RNA polymerase sigma-70 factor (ECF subfamily)
LLNKAGDFMLEDRLLIVRFNRGDKGVLHRLYEKYKDDLVTLAAALLFDKATAEDVVHDVFIAFCHGGGRFRLTGSLKGYLMTCVANRARNCNKAARRRTHASLDDAAPTASSDVRPDQAAIFDEQLDTLRRALAQLPYEQRETLLLRSFGHMRFAAMAKAQGVSINTVQGRYRYAMDKLRALLDSEADQ